MIRTVIDLTLYTEAAHKANGSDVLRELNLMKTVREHHRSTNRGKVIRLLTTNVWRLSHYSVPVLHSYNIMWTWHCMRHSSSCHNAILLPFKYVKDVLEEQSHTELALCACIHKYCRTDFLHDVKCHCIRLLRLTLMLPKYATCLSFICILYTKICTKPFFSIAVISLKLCFCVTQGIAAVDLSGLHTMLSWK